MTANSMNAYRMRLQALSDLISKDASDLSGRLGGQSPHLLRGELSRLTELESNQAEADLAMAILDRERLLAEEVEAALKRLDDGTFGLCTQCHRAISDARLHAVPYTRLCTQCVVRRKAVKTLVTTG
jgi:DnaK suppressor protein